MAEALPTGRRDMAVRSLDNQARTLRTLLAQLQEGETLLVAFDEPGIPHGGRALQRWTEPELTRCILAANRRSITFYAIQRSALLPRHRLGWQ
jgi:hypothetical protein